LTSSHALTQHHQKPKKLQSHKDPEVGWEFSAELPVSESGAAENSRLDRPHLMTHHGDGKPPEQLEIRKQGSGLFATQTNDDVDF
jgi:hypothetical protein